METTFGSRFKKFRIFLCFNQEEIGKKIGLARTTISNVEVDKYVINAQVLTLLIETYPKLDIHWLLTGKGDMLKEKSISDERVDMLKELIDEKNARIKILEELLSTYRK